MHLAGAGIGDKKWTPARKELILQSRTRGTGLLARTLAELREPPRVMVSGSAVGYYGNRGDELLTEGSAPGDDFTAEVCQAWEAATAPASDAGIRVVCVRTGIVLAAHGGALQRLLLPFKLGLGGRVASGRQYMSWITLDDEAGAIVHALGADDVRGPLNLTAPNPVTNAELTDALGRALHRPTVLPTPLMPLKVLYGAELVQSLLVDGQRVSSAKLVASGYEFAHTDLDDALRAVLRKHRGRLTRSLNGTVVRLWIDTDVGDDPDDVVALVCADAHPDVEVVGVSVVGGASRSGPRSPGATSTRPSTSRTARWQDAFRAARPEALLAIGPLDQRAARSSTPCPPCP